MLKAVFYIILPSVMITSCFGAKFGFSRQINDSNKLPVANANVYFLNKKGDTIRSTISDIDGTIQFEGSGSARRFEKYTFRYLIVKEGYHEIYREDEVGLIPDTLVLIKKDEL